MNTNTFSDTLRSFFGLPTAQERGNEFRNPIWASDDEDDDDDELYHHKGYGPDFNSSVNIEVFTDPSDFHQVITQQMEEMMKSFGAMFSDMRLLPGEHFCPPMDPPRNNNSIRDEYLKPGYKDKEPEIPFNKDMDLDGKITSADIAGFLNNKEENLENSTLDLFERQKPVFSNTYFQTVITQSITRPDGSVETRRITKDQHGNVEETVTSTTTSKVNSDGVEIAPYQKNNPIINLFDDFFNAFSRKF